MEIVKYFFESTRNFLLLLLVIHVIRNPRALNEIIRMILKPVKWISRETLKYYLQKKKEK